MKPKKQTGLNMSKKTKIVLTVIGTIIITLLMCLSYKYGNIAGTLQGHYEAVGTEGMCEKLNKVMEGDYCAINDEDTYKHYVNCTWGNLIVYSEKEHKLMNWDIRFKLVQCKRVTWELTQ